MLLRWILLAASLAEAIGTESVYKLRPSSSQRETQAILNPNDILSFSEEGDPRTLSSFLLDIFKTDGVLSDDALEHIREAMSLFLIEKVNAIYGDRKLESVGTEITQNLEIIGDVNADGSVDLGDRFLQQDIKGTELEMQVTLTFEIEPPPANTGELEKAVADVMQDLTGFVSILTDPASLQDELDEVYLAIRREHPTEAPTAAPVVVIDPVVVIPNNQGKPQVQSSNNTVGSTTIIFAPILVGATLLALATYLVFRRKRNTEPESPKGDMMYVDVENDGYSHDRSLESPPNGGPSPFSAESVYTSNYSVSQVTSPRGGGDSIFSGVESTKSTTPTNNVHSANSLLSGMTNASTIVASNNNRDPKKYKSPTSMSGVSQHASLFAFSEGEGEGGDEEYELEEYELVERAFRPPSLTESDVSDDSQDVLPCPSETSSHLQGDAIEHPLACFLGDSKAWYGGDDEDPATTTHVLADLAHFSSKRDPSPARDPTPTHSASATRARDPTPRSTLDKVDNTTMAYSARVSSISTDVSAPLPEKKVLEKSTNGAQVLAISQADSILATGFVSSPDPSVNSTMETPLKRNFALTSATPGSAAATVVSHKSAHSHKSAKSTSSGRSTQIHLEWEQNVEAPGTVAQMSAKATHMMMMGGVVGFGEGENRSNGGSRSRASTMEGGSQPTTPGSKPPTPNRGNGSRPTTPKGGLEGGSNQNHMSRSDVVKSNIAGLTPGYGDYMNCLNPNLKMIDHAPEDEQADEGAFPTASGGRRHVGNNMEDGTADYQTSAMNPLDWSYKSVGESLGDSTLSGSEGAGLPRQFIFSPSKNNGTSASTPISPSARFTPKSPMSYTSTISESARTGGTTKETTTSSHASALINDLVWLEKKIADVRGQSGSTALLSKEQPPVIETVDSLSYVSDEIADIRGQSGSTALVPKERSTLKIADVGSTALLSREQPPGIETVDSLSYVSEDGLSGCFSPSSNGDSAAANSAVSIVCRDCFAPPGKLHIVIHSTKDGPAVHTVKEGSSLEGHIFSGDLIMSVDDVDTRAFTAEQVMKMMAAKSGFDRKITVLHFDDA
jgi:hypothetical protein